MSKTLGVLTSGGDCPGLNACLRAIVRTASGYGAKVIGFKKGFFGLVNSEYIYLDFNAVSGILNLGGTILGTERFPEFCQLKYRQNAVKTIEEMGINGLIIIGGNGSLKGAYLLSKIADIPIIGIPKTIDNDVGGTEFSIGFDTAVNTAVEAIDRLRDTARSHNRLFLVEVMGRAHGFLALAVALASGAEGVLVPEIKTDIEQVVKAIEKSKKLGKSSNIIVIAEGDEIANIYDLAKMIQKRIEVEVRVAVLGHIQRGGSPSAFDRMLATKLGAAAVDAWYQGIKGKMVGYVKGKIKLCDLQNAWKRTPEFNYEDLKLIARMSGIAM